MKKRKDGRYQKKVLVNDKWKYFYGRTQKELNEKIKQYERLIVKKTNFDEVACEWSDMAYQNLVAKTIGCYEPAKRRAIAKFKKRKVHTIAPKEIQEFINEFARQGYSKQTVNVQLIVVRCIFRFATIQGYVDINPATEIKMPRGLSKSKRNPPSDRDLELIKKSYNEPFGLFACMLLYTGMRPGEARALHWEDIELYDDTGIIKINKAITTDMDGNTPVLKETKTTNGNRTVPILRPLMKILRQFYKESGIVFANKYDKYMTATECRNAWTTYINIVGIDCTPYQLRHAYSTMLYEAGVPDKDAQMFMGHSTITLTRDIYTTIRQKQKNKSTQLLNEYLSDIS